MNYDELWMPVIGYEGLYEISNKGRVKSVARVLINCQNIRREWPSKILKPQQESHGYTQVTLYRSNGRGKNFKIHRLVAESFLAGSRGDAKEVNHIDGNKQNNSVINLAWVTRLENSQHAWENKLISIKYGEETSGAKLSNTEVQQIRARYRRYGKENSAVSLAKEFNVTRQAIADIVHNKTWRVEYEIR